MKMPTKQVSPAFSQEITFLFKKVIELYHLKKGETNNGQKIHGNIVERLC